MTDENTKYYINPTGRFVIGGPHGDSGLTGRKLIVDTYGGMAPPRRRSIFRKRLYQGGQIRSLCGPVCGKKYRGLQDWRKNVRSSCPTRSEWHTPTSIMVDTFGTGRISDQKLVEIIRENFDLRPAGIIRMLDLRRPIYKQTAAYGHFGRTDIDLPWEKLDKVETLRKYL